MTDRQRRLICCAILLPSLLMVKRVFAAQTRETFTKIELALQAVREGYGIATGLEIADADPDNTPITLDLSVKDPTSLFEGIALQRSAYVWKLEGGVYEMYPKAASDRISEMSVALYYVNDATPQEASDAITRLPELQRWLSDHHAKRSEIILGPRWGVHPEQTKISLELHNIPLRTILNQLFPKVGSNGWAVTRWGDKKQFLAINF
jgi:hypothetical protein